MSKKSGILLDEKKPRHKDGVRLDRAWNEDADARKQIARNGLAKRAVTASFGSTTKDASSGGDPGSVKMAGPTMPTEEQMAKITPLLGEPKAPEELVVLPTLSLNNLEDRDEDRFTDECVTDFHALQAPYSFIGKSFMLDHEYESFNTVGRIFDENVLSGDAIKWLTHDVYVPNTPQFQPFIERVSFGLSWAVSVGVMLGKSACSVCGGGFNSWGYWCANGHDKGYWYLEEAEVDNWGYPLPCDSNTPGAVKCIREFSEPRDGYELSQVYLGAQYFAGFGKGAEAGVQKAARTVKAPKEFGGMEVPILGLKTAEAENIPFSHEPARVTEARQNFGVDTQDDGSVRWVDDEKIVWQFDPFDEDREVLSLGRSADETPTANKDGEDDGEHGIPGGSGSEGVGQVDGEPAPDEEAGVSRQVGEGGEGGDPDGLEVGDQGSPSLTSDPDEPEPEGSDDEDEPEGESKTVKAMRSTLERSKKLRQLAADTEASEDANALALSLGVLEDEIETTLSADEDRADEAVLSESEVELLEAADDAADALAVELDAEEDEDDDSEPEPAEEDDTKSAKLNVKSIQRKALKAGVPALIVGKWAASESATIDGLLALVGAEMKAASGGVVSKEITAKAKLGDAYIKQLRADAIAAYVLAHRDPKSPDKGVSTEAFEKALDRICEAGDDKTLKELIEQNKDTARRQFPESVRRSTMPVNPEVSDGPSELPEDQTDDDSDHKTAKANRLHDR